MQNTETIPANYQSIAEKVRSGEFFRESRAMYDLTVHDPMAERYLYVLITGMAASVFMISIVAVQSLYPLETAVPFIVGANDLSEEMPTIKSLLAYEGENIDVAMTRFMANNYTQFREEYEIGTFERNANGVKSQSSPEVLAEFDKFIDPANPSSPIALYQRHSKRSIEISETRPSRNQENAMEVVFEAKVEGNGQVKKTRWQANIAFNYSGITLDEETGKVKPVTFVVTQYRTKRLQDLQ